MYELCIAINLGIDIIDLKINWKWVDPTPYPEELFY